MYFIFRAFNTNIEIKSAFKRVLYFMIYKLKTLIQLTTHVLLEVKGEKLSQRHLPDWIVAARVCILVYSHLSGKEKARDFSRTTYLIAYLQLCINICILFRK